MEKREKSALLVVGLNSSIMGLAMFIMHYIFNYSYNNPEMTYVLLFFEIFMSIIAYVGYKKLGLSYLSNRFHFSKWGIPYLIIFILLVIFIIFSSELTGNFTLLIFIFLTNLLVGFSEELLFRGIVLPVFMEKKKIGSAILISSLCFSSFHIVNLLGGTSILETVIQLVLTFIFGIVLSCMLLQINNIIPLMMFHFIWDLALDLEQMSKASTGFVSTTGLILNIIVFIPIFIYTVKKY